MELRYWKSSEEILHLSLECNKHIIIYKKENKNKLIDMTNKE